MLHKMKRLLLVIVYIAFVSNTIYAEVFTERQIPNGGIAKVAYINNNLYVIIHSEIKTEYLIDISIVCKHKWKTDGVTNSDGTFSPGTWKEETYIVCNNIFNNIRPNEQVLLTEGVNNPPQNSRTDLYTDFDVIINNVRAKSEMYRMVFYAWGSGTKLGEMYKKSTTGHAFVYIPDIGYRGFSSKEGGYLGEEGEISDHQELVQFATDSCVVYITKEQLNSVKNKYRELESNVPKYTVTDYDCTSFTMDMADAAGIQYGIRKIIQWPTSFITGMKNHNNQ